MIYCSFFPHFYSASSVQRSSQVPPTWGQQRQDKRHLMVALAGIEIAAVVVDTVDIADGVAVVVDTADVAVAVDGVDTAGVAVAVVYPKLDTLMAIDSEVLVDTLDLLKVLAVS